MDRACAVLLVAGLLSACKDAGGEKDSFDFDPGSTSASGSGDDGDDTGGDDDGGDSSGGDTGSSGDGMADDTGGTGGGDSYALGTIVLGENHPVGAPDPVTATPYINASFVPDASAPPSGCVKDVVGCEVVLTPECAEPCEDGTTCIFDDACQSVCGLPCDLACAADEVCYYPIPGAPACKKIDVFDAGTLTFDGTTVPITAYPPYNAVGGPTGAPFLPDADLSVAASGAAGAGFDAFEGSFTGVGNLVTHMDEINPADAYGVGHLPVAWDPGDDDLRVSVTVTTTLGTVGSFVCSAVDSTGTYNIPRPALSEAAHDEQIDTVAVTLERRKSMLIEGLGTHGTVLEGMVQPQGQVELVSASAESTTILNCGGVATWCTGVCADLQTDAMHCGTCGNACDELEVCTAGVCG